MHHYYISGCVFPDQNILNLQSSQLGKTDEDSSSPVACIVLQELQKIAGKKHSSRIVPTWFLHVLLLKNVASSTIVFYYQVLGGNQWHWQ